MLRHPDLKVDVSLTNRIVDLIEEQIDAVVRISIVRDSSLIMQPLAMAKFMVCAAPSYLKRYGTPQTIADLKDYNCLAFISPWTGKSYDWRFQQDGEEVMHPVQGNFRVDNGEALLESAIAGVGIAQLYNYIAAEAIACGQLKPILQNVAPSGSPISVVYPQKRHLSAKVRAFVEFMQALMAELKQKSIVG
jgi:LysR family transcriptional regulator for bpeEF and oprC